MSHKEKIVEIGIYEHDRPCPKCGQKDIANRFIKKHDMLDDEYGSITRADKDIMRRYCRNCQYVWYELPLK